MHPYYSEYNRDLGCNCHTCIHALWIYTYFILSLYVGHACIFHMLLARTDFVISHHDRMKLRVSFSHTLPQHKEIKDMDGALNKYPRFFSSATK